MSGLISTELFGYLRIGQVLLHSCTSSKLLALALRNNNRYAVIVLNFIDE